MALSGPNRFSPGEVTVNQGETVTWMNGGGTHNVRFDDGSYEMPADPANTSWTVSRTFDMVGRFTYICREHGSSMSGVVNVVAAGTPPPGGGPPAQEPGEGGSPGPGPGGPAPGGQPRGDRLKVTLKLSDATPPAGRAVRLSGAVSPARDGRRLQIQKRLRGGRFKTIATTRLRAAKGDRSTYSVKLRLSRDAVLRARVAGEDDFSKTRKLDIHRAA